MLHFFSIFKRTLSYYFFKKLNIPVIYRLNEKTRIATNKFNLLIYIKYKYIKNLIDKLLFKKEN